MIAKIPDPLLPLAVPIDTLRLDPANARKGHDLDMIAASLNQYGQRKPIVVNAKEGNKVEAGNGTLQAAKRLGWTHIAAVVVEDDPITAVGYSISDNRSSELSEWDDEVLATLLQSLDLDEVVTGFDSGDLDELLAGLGKGLELEQGDAEPQTDRAEELRRKWGVELGQLWADGDIRFFCGDAIECGEKGATLVITDPPYDMGAEMVAERLLKFADVAMMIASDRQMVEVAKILHLRINLIWRHRQPRSFPTMHQPVMYHHQMPLFTKEKETKHTWIRPTPDFGSVVEIEGTEFVDTQIGHGKSAALFLAMIRQFGDKKIADPFMGSGASAIAAKQSGRKYIGCEINPATFAVALERYSSATGTRPILISHEHETD